MVSALVWDGWSMGSSSWNSLVTPEGTIFWADMVLRPNSLFFGTRGDSKKLSPSVFAGQWAQVFWLRIKWAEDFLSGVSRIGGFWCMFAALRIFEDRFPNAEKKNVDRVNSS